VCVVVHNKEKRDPVYRMVWLSDMSLGCKEPNTPVVFIFPVFSLLTFINYMGMLKYNFML
jgi:hypothetical protein